MRMPQLEEGRVSSGWALLVLIVLGFSLRLYVLLNAATISVDGFSYINIAKGFFEGNSSEALNVIRRPLYPFLLGLTSQVIGDYELSGRVVSLVFGTAVVAVSFYLGRAVYNERAGLVAAFFVAIHPYMVRYSGDVLTEGLYLFLVATVTLSGLKAVSQRSAGWMSVAALFAVLAYLARPGAIIVWGVIILWVVFYDFARVREDWGKRAGPLVVGFLTLMAMAVPYLVLIPGEGGGLGLGGGLSISSLDPVLSVLQSFGFGEKLLKFLKDFPQGFTVPFLILFVWGVLKRKREGLGSSQYYLLAVMLVPGLFYLGVNPSERYFVHLMPVALVFSAMGFCYLERWLEVRAGEKAALATAVFVIAICAAELPGGLVSLHAHRLPERHTGEWLKKNAEGPYTIMARKPIVAFYSDGGFVHLTGGTLREVIEYGEQQGAEYMAGYSSSLKKNIPDFEGEKERFLREVKRFKAGGEDEFVLYRVGLER